MILRLFNNSEASGWNEMSGRMVKGEVFSGGGKVGIDVRWSECWKRRYFL
jgi:hypothetical protein